MKSLCKVATTIVVSGIGLLGFVGSATADVVTQGAVDVVCYTPNPGSGYHDSNEPGWINFIMVGAHEDGNPDRVSGRFQSNNPNVVHDVWYSYKAHATIAIHHAPNDANIDHIDAITRDRSGDKAMDAHIWGPSHDGTRPDSHFTRGVPGGVPCNR